MKKKREDPNKQNKTWKRRSNNWYHRNTKKKKKEREREEYTGEPRRNGQVSRNIQAAKTEIRRNSLNRLITRNEIESVI